MDAKPRRCPLQFSLRTLMVVITLIGLVFARIAYLNQMAKYHEAEVEQIARELQGDLGWQDSTVNEIRQRIATMADSDGPILVGKMLAGWPGLGLVAGQEFISLDENVERPEEPWIRAIHETRIASAYQRAVWRPWQLVNEPPPLKVEYKSTR